MKAKIWISFLSALLFLLVLGGCQKDIEFHCDGEETPVMEERSGGGEFDSDDDCNGDADDDLPGDEDDDDGVTDDDDEDDDDELEDKTKD